MAKTLTPSRKSSTTSHARQPQDVRPTTLALQAQFLEHYASVGVLTAAARMTGMDRKRHYDWLAEPDKYPDYAERFKDAHEQACDRLETEAVRRAVQGWEEPVYQGGKLVGTVRRYSDKMLELMLKSRRPTAFRERLSAELLHQGDASAPLQTIMRVIVDPKAE